jgi:AraC-like DNA-binding protein
MAFVYILEHGDLDLVRPRAPVIQLREPSLLLCPSTCRYKLRSTPGERARLVCASFDFGQSANHPSPLGVQDALVFARSSVDNAAPLVDAIVNEYSAQAPGRQRGLSMLFEYLLLLLVRKSFADGLVSKGLLAAMLDTRLASSLLAMHSSPDRDWSIDELAANAGMSRSAFCQHFQNMLAVSPIAYLTAWRVKLAKDLIRDGTELKVVAATLGYSSQATFTRAFARELGLPPAEWRRSIENDAVTDHGADWWPATVAT